MEELIFADFTKQELAAFRLGVWGAVKTGILKGLFRVRINQLFNK